MKEFIRYYYYVIQWLLLFILFLSIFAIFFYVYRSPPTVFYISCAADCVSGDAAISAGLIALLVIWTLYFLGLALRLGQERTRRLMFWSFAILFSLLLYWQRSRPLLSPDVLWIRHAAAASLSLLVLTVSVPAYYYEKRLLTIRNRLSIVCILVSFVVLGYWCRCLLPGRSFVERAASAIEKKDVEMSRSILKGELLNTPAWSSGLLGHQQRRALATILVSSDTSETEKLSCDFTTLWSSMMIPDAAVLVPISDYNSLISQVQQDIGVAVGVTEIRPGVLWSISYPERLREYLSDCKDDQVPSTRCKVALVWLLGRSILDYRSLNN